MEALLDNLYSQDINFTEFSRREGVLKVFQKVEALRLSAGSSRHVSAKEQTICSTFILQNYYAAATHQISQCKTILENGWRIIRKRSEQV